MTKKRTGKKVCGRFDGRKAVSDDRQMTLPFPPPAIGTAEFFAEKMAEALSGEAWQSDYLKRDNVDPITHDTRRRLVEKLIEAGHLPALE